MCAEDRQPKAEREVQAVLRELIQAIEEADVEAYRRLVAEEVTCFEPETGGPQVKGRDMHLFFVRNTTPPDQYFFEIIDPTIKVCGELAYAAYSFLLAEVCGDETVSATENVTRIFQNQDGRWKLVHFHRSGLSGS